MRRVPLTDPATGDTIYATAAGAEVLRERGYRDAGQAPEPEQPEALEDLKRDQLNERARDAGVEDPEGLPNKAAVIDAIRSTEG